MRFSRYFVLFGLFVVIPGKEFTTKRTKRTKEKARGA